mmetsp:Transcript_6245/g.12363  ORF Transcript_6245/g.12363 Transcript_6245/m.12363 type:complete len:108 (-) Transcript_6245:5927-6250(-)
MSEVARFVEETIGSYKVVVFSKTYCGYCKTTEKLISETVVTDAVSVVYLDRRDDGAAIQEYLLTKTRQSTVPNTFIDGKHVGGNDDLQRLHRQGQYIPLLRRVGAAK